MEVEIGSKGCGTPPLPERRTSRLRARSLIRAHEPTVADHVRSDFPGFGHGAPSMRQPTGSDATYGRYRRKDYGPKTTAFHSILRIRHERRRSYVALAPTDPRSRAWSA
jgi:hypothetical protein